MKQKYHLKKAVEYGCTVYQVINSETGVIAFYDKDENVAKQFLDKYNNMKK